MNSQTPRSHTMRDAVLAPSSAGLRSIVGTIAVIGSLALAGCATPAAGSEAPTPGQSSAAVPASTPTAGVTDADSCLAIGDVVSIAHNADVAVGEGRMSAQEQAGWYRLATTALARLPTQGEGPVSEAVTALQAAVPPVPLAAAGRTEIGSDAWGEQVAEVLKACEEAGSEVVTVAFTGG